MVFDKSDVDTNPLLPCNPDSHHKLDVQLWREETGGGGGDDDRRRGKAFQTGSSFCDFHGNVVLPGLSVRTSACVECICDLSTGSGGKCRSIVVESCEDLISDVGSEAVRVDAACQEQCAMAV